MERRPHEGPAAFALTLALATAASGSEYHVSLQGRDANPGTLEAPFRTIQRAADVAQPGDTLTVHEGIYRERVNPPRGGLSDTERIVYQAAPGEKVEIRGSEVVSHWARVKADVWRAEVDNAMFGAFNPFADELRGDWFDPRGRKHHTGAVYVDGDWLVEAASLDEVLAGTPSMLGPLWFAQVGEKTTHIHAQFPGGDPNQRLVEVNVRRTVFYPDAPGRNYITVRGFALRHAATPWAPPTAEQIGLIGTHWSRGWIIERNTVSHSVSSGISLGKHGDAHDNTSADTAEGYVETIKRAHAHPVPWRKGSVGHHVVRDNEVSHCEQAGIVGSLGAAFSLVTGNTIHDIHVRKLFTGAEMAGIKLHGAVDTEISGNHIYRTCRGLWLDWMAQGTRVARNLFHDNDDEDLFVEVNHGPFLVDNNLFLSKTNLLDVSEGGAYVHNLWAGKIMSGEEPNRLTPYHPAHSTAIGGLVPTRGGDDRFYNNVFVGVAGAALEPPSPTDWAHRTSGYGLQAYDQRSLPLQTGGNVYLSGARPYAREAEAVVRLEASPRVELMEDSGALYLRLVVGAELDAAATRLVTTDLLGKPLVAQVPYENADGSPVTVDRDFLGNPRDRTRPTPGPFERSGRGELKLRLR